MSFRIRLAGKYLLDLGLWALAAPLAFVLRLDGIPPILLQSAIQYTLISLPVKAIIIFALSLYRQSWRRLSIRDLYHILQGAALAGLVDMALGFLVFTDIVLPRSIPLLDALLAVILLGGVRLLARLGLEAPLAWNLNRSARRVLVVGAGDAGVMIARELLQNPTSERAPIGFLDDDPEKQYQQHMGLEVLGGILKLPQVVRDERVEEVLIAMPSAPGKVIRHVVELARSSNVEYRIIPSVYDIISGRVPISQIREVDLEDLLRREPVQLQLTEIEHYLQGKTVLVTGAGGSIGSELVRQIARFKPVKVVMLGHGEYSLYQFERELDRLTPPIVYQTVVASLQRKEKLVRVIETTRPDVIFHAAAHKHVPLMELNADEAIINNVGGTRNLLLAAVECGVSRFINISSDKAVNPTSIMGASKRVAEYLVEAASRRVPEGHVYASVRFGNVLGSRGSVVPLFKEQIRNGGPVTITDPEMTRYFMTIPEATQLVLQAGSLGHNGAVYVLDMGDPVKIMALARDLIELSGFVPDDDIEIVYTGIRPGEKLYEEPLPFNEGMVHSQYDKIYVAHRSGVPTNLDELVARLLQAAEDQDQARIRQILKDVVPSYHPGEYQSAPTRRDR